MNIDTITLPTWAIILIVVIGFFTLIAIYLRLDSLYERREDKAFKRSVKVRAQIMDQLHETQNRLKPYNLDDHDTPEITELNKVMANINSASRDGRRSTDYIENLSKKLPDLEKKALESIGVQAAA
jgi:hypothetical protein